MSTKFEESEEYFLALDWIDFNLFWIEYDLRKILYEVAIVKAMLKGDL